MDEAKFNQAFAEIRPKFDEIGKIMLKHFPAIDLGGPGAIDKAHVEMIAEVTLAGIAEMLTWWHNAGSEREATLENEELLKQLKLEFEGWAVTAEVQK